MTKKAFKYDMQRGLGSCILALKKMQDAEKEAFFPIVLWGCSRNMAYNNQLEYRSAYMYELIMEFSDVTPFIDAIEKRLRQCSHLPRWEFTQYCDLLSWFAGDGVKRAWTALNKCYDTLFQILQKKRSRPEGSNFSERNNFEEVCISLVNMCFDDREWIEKQYQRIIRDLGNLISENRLYSFADFEWFQTVSEKKLGKTAVQELLYHNGADEGTKIYRYSMEQYQSMTETAKAQHMGKQPETADEIYERLRNGEKLEQICNRLRVHGFMVKNKEQEALKIAAYYKYEESEVIRCSLLRLLAYPACAWTVDLEQLIMDSKSTYPELSQWAFEVLHYRTDASVRAYALELLQSRKHMAKAVSMLVANYEDRDKKLLVETVKQIPITYESNEWHEVFHDTMDLFGSSAKVKPKELLFYMYRNTLCSFCREDIVKEMGRRRMLTRELLEEMQYDCNGDIRKYAKKKLSTSYLRAVRD